MDVFGTAHGRKMQCELKRANISQEKEGGEGR
jgi:hypothetical protein